jgi:charged multivesicular body protein 5
MTALKRRKTYEQQRDSLMNQGFNLDQAAFVQSSLADTQTTVAAMKHANSAMKTQFKQIDPDDVYNLQGRAITSHQTHLAYN